MKNLKTGFVHTVFFWQKNKGNAADHAALHAGINKLSEIDLIKTAYIGTPANTNRAVIDTTWDFSITWIFDNDADQAAYQTHPEHLKFVENCRHLWEKVQVYDAES
jgi:Stress responsive A/B Barrel Domain